jgi:hypothetical protein
MTIQHGTLQLDSGQFASLGKSSKLAIELTPMTLHTTGKCKADIQDADESSADSAHYSIAFFLPCFSLCKLVTEVLLHGTAGFEDARAVLAVAHGYFARISPMLPTHDFFNQVTELIDVAVEAHKSVT